ncbi:beta and beta-prime subunits of DNA dependent RNA-polymerase [Mycena leptocephala]|nr:beta and beta-prime subunits of DNA dependent RNA-polymerase [Mycena leptocephala]
MLGHQFVQSGAPIRKVNEVQFGIFSPEEIRRYSVAEIKHADLYDQDTSIPKLGGLMDPRMGPIDSNFNCLTCGEGILECPGHFAHIELARPLFHPGFIFKVKKILECICINCGKLRADISDPGFKEKIRRIPDPKKCMAVIWAHGKTRLVCELDRGERKEAHAGCGYVQQRIRKEGLQLFAENAKPKLVSDGDETMESELDVDGDETMESPQPKRRLLSPSDVYTTFIKISDPDLELLGLSRQYARPEWMILTVLPVPPITVRPSIATDMEGTRKDNYLTLKLGDIIRASAEVRRCEQEGQPAHVIREFEERLQFHVATYMDDDIPGIPRAPQNSSRPVKSLAARLKVKQGRLRCNLLSKRVDFCARIVVTGDPNIELDEVGVPRCIAMKLTYPERATPYNIGYLQEFVGNGPAVYPGANYVVCDTGERIDLRYNKSANELIQYGWIVERHLKDGEFLLLNRQPSPSKTSMMAHRVKVMPYSTFRLNPSVAQPYNANFDGDEMNMHVPQSEEARAELSEIAWVPRQIISPATNKPILGLVQDSLFGVYKFTLRDTFLDWNQVQNILLWVPEWNGVVPMPAIIKPKPLWTGKQILGLVIPRGINVAHSSDGRMGRFNPVSDDWLMMIENGEILFGAVDKKTVSSLIEVVFREKGAEATMRYISGVQKVVGFWLFHSGFSLGVGDLIIDAATMSYVTATVAQGKAHVTSLIHDANHDHLKAGPGKTTRESFEYSVQGVLDYARGYSGSYVQRSWKKDNNMKQMLMAGSAGSSINVTQMTACVGQQSVDGGRIPFGFRHRTLPHYLQDDFSPEARGFVESTYMRGLTPQEFFFHAMAGREDLVNAEVKRADIGHIRVRLIKALEDVMVCYDGTARNSRGDVIQLVYGEDGMDSAFIERQTIDTFALNDEEFKHNYHLDVMDEKNGSGGGVLLQGYPNGELPWLQTKLDEEFKQLAEDGELLRTLIFQRDVSSYLPVNLQRVVKNAAQMFHIDRRQPSELDPVYIIDAVKALGERLIIVRGDDSVSKQAQEDACCVFRMHLRATLAARQVVDKYRLSREAFDSALGEVESKFNQAIVTPAEMCGILAAQSIAEAAAQMKATDISYRPGTSANNALRGVPRLQEIINVAANIATPSLTVYLNPDISDDPSRSQRVARGLEDTPLRAVTSAVEIWYDPDPTSTVLEDDVGFVEDFFAIPDEAVDSTLHLQSPWVLRLELIRMKMVGKLNMCYVAGRIAERFGGDLFVIWNEDNSDKLVIRCRWLNKTEDGMVADDTFLRRIENTMLDSVSLCGVKGIRRTFLRQYSKAGLDADGGINIRKQSEWVLETEGTNLKAAIGVDGVDYTRTYSNSCVEIFNVLGIEAARAAILQELRDVIEWDGSYIDYRHLALLCDLMTHRGTLTPLTRHGINNGALNRCSPQKTAETLLEAAAVGEKNGCCGVVENLMFGQMPPMGTGAFDVALDIDMLLRLHANP